MRERVDASEFPDGLRCMRCKRLLDYGELFDSVPDAVTSEGVPIEELICVTCLS